MLKTEYLGYKLDSVERWAEEEWRAYYGNSTKHVLVTGKGRNPENACASAQKKIKIKVEKSGG